MGNARIQRIRIVGALTISSLLAVTIGFGAYITSAMFNRTRNLEPTGGEVSLRSYFQKGSGTYEDPFVISRPIHFYNLSRLQNLGVFSSAAHFVLGYDPSHPDDVRGKSQGTDLTFYADNSSNTLVGNHTLDMTDVYSLTDSIASIGDEQTPFYGDFDGQGLAIKGLKISSKPEDVGVFGYTYPGSSVHDLYLIDPVVTDDGYETSTEIAPIFNDPDNPAYAGSVTWKSGVSNHDVGSVISTSTSLFDNKEVPFDDGVTNPEVKITATLPNLPSSMSNVNCEYRSSCPLISLGEVQGTQISRITFNKNLLSEDPQFNAFATCDNGGTFHVRISLVASSVTNAGVHYSKTISSFLIVLIRHVDENDDETFSYQVIKDAFDGETNGLTQYRHGANIGLLCGHAEGSFTNCFVYGGTISLNNQKSGITPLFQESETGLFGEIGASVDSSISPQKNYEGDKDTGVLNFSKMYEDIAGGTHQRKTSGDTVYYEYTPGEHEEHFIATGGSNTFNLKYQPTSKNDTTVTVDGSSRDFDLDGSSLTITGNMVAPGKTVTISYSSDSAEKFSQYLRNNQLDDGRKYVTKYNNTVDFIGRQIIEDTESDKRKGMGVFSLVTTASQSDTYDTYLMNELGGFVIKKDEANTFTDFYYTTAEWNADPDGDGRDKEYVDIAKVEDGVNTWSDMTGARYHINQPNTFPANITPKTWNPYFERYFNYNIHCDFSPNSTVNNYFFNTQSEFLKSYFTYKLRNSSGEAPGFLTPAFGVFVRDINPDTGAESAITKFDSVLEISEEDNNRFTSLSKSYSESFVGNGKDRHFELKHIPIPVDNPTMTIKVGEVQTNAFSCTNNTLTFDTAPADGVKVTVDYTYQNPTKSVVFSIKNSGGANVTLFAASNSSTDAYVGIYDTKRADLYQNNSNVTSKPDYAMYCPYYPATETLERASFHYYNYDYASGETPMTAEEASPSQANRLYAHTFYLKQGEYIVSSPEGKAQLVYLCAQGQNGKGNTGLTQPNGAEAIRDVDFIAQEIDPTLLTLDSSGNLYNQSENNIRCYFSFNSIWDNTVADEDGINDLKIYTGLSGGAPTIDIDSGSNLMYLLADNEGRFSCTLNGDIFERQFYEYTRPSA